MIENLIKKDILYEKLLHVPNLISKQYELYVRCNRC